MENLSAIEQVNDKLIFVFKMFIFLDDILGLNFHVRTHNKERPYACDVCGKSFGAQSHLDWHKMIHTGI